MRTYPLVAGLNMATAHLQGSPLGGGRISHGGGMPRRGLLMLGKAAFRCRRVCLWGCRLPVVGYHRGGAAGSAGCRA